jgi:hypothetical protein
VIPACKLWEKVSAKGNRYLIGRMGGVRVMVMTNSRPDGEKRRQPRSHLRGSTSVQPEPGHIGGTPIAVKAGELARATQREDASDRG